MRTLMNWAVSDGSLILVNAACPLAEAHSPEALTEVGPEGSGVLMARRAAILLEQLMTRLHGWDALAPVSGWRSYDEQKALWDDSVRDNGLDFTRQYVAAPGASEHQTGLAIDLGLRGAALDFIRPAFPDTGVCRQFRLLAARYGFILRYPAGKEKITGIAHEPWHFRYVGIPHAGLMVQLGLTLEEYLQTLRTCAAQKTPLRFGVDSFTFQVDYVPQAQADALPPEGLISGDNQAGYIATTWICKGN